VTRALAGALAVAAVAVACGSGRGPGHPYGLHEVERAFERHHVDTGRFGDLTDRRLPDALSRADLKKDVVVGFAWGRRVSVWVFSSEGAAAARLSLGRKLEPPVRVLRKGNVLVGADWPYLPRNELRRVRAALGDLD
jgi:hypothetical protein